MAKDTAVKTVVRGIVREELDVALKASEDRLKKDLTRDLTATLSAEIDRKLDQKLDQKLGQLKDDFYSKIDGFLKLYKDHEEDHTMLLSRNDDLEERSKKMESIHPNFQHPAACC